MYRVTRVRLLRGQLGQRRCSLRPRRPPPGGSRQPLKRAVFAGRARASPPAPRACAWRRYTRPPSCSFAARTWASESAARGQRRAREEGGDGGQEDARGAEAGAFAAKTHAALLQQLFHAFARHFRLQLFQRLQGERWENGSGLRGARGAASAAAFRTRAKNGQRPTRARERQGARARAPALGCPAP